MNLSSLAKESKAVQSGPFIETVENVAGLLREESGKTGNLTISENS
jgi:hypothetical protein